MAGAMNYYIQQHNYRLRVVKQPRKAHVCDCCGEPIKESYAYISFVGSNALFRVLKLHLTCYNKLREMCLDCNHKYSCSNETIKCYKHKVSIQQLKEDENG